MRAIKKFSDIFGPFTVDVSKKKITSKSHKLFLDTSMTRFNDGFATLTPTVTRSLRKLEKLIRREMDELSAQEIILPSLINQSLLETSGRATLPDLYKIRPSDSKNYVLSPTHEEEITNLVASFKYLQGKQLPLRFYQIGNKFRDEKRVKSGLLRAKEFIMNDLYCFDMNLEKSQKTFDEVCKRYQHFFETLKVPFIIVNSNPGNIGGLYSKEFHFVTEAGEDKILMCQNCGLKENCNNVNISDNSQCSGCQSKNVKVENGIEVAHAFNLGTKYSEVFEATFLDEKNKSHLIHMGSYGLGLSRILAATVEVLSTRENIQWPLAIAPYLVSIISLRDDLGKSPTPEAVYYGLNECLPDEVVYFDKSSQSIGKRFLIAKKVGFPFVVVMGKTYSEDPPVVELHDMYSGTMDLVQVSDLNQTVMDKLLGKSDKEVVFDRV